MVHLIQMKQAEIKNTPLICQDTASRSFFNMAKST